MKRTLALLLVAGCAAGTQSIGELRDVAAAGSGASRDAGALPALGDAMSIDGDDSGGIVGPSCATAEHSAKLAALDMLILLDQSGSMTEDDDRWTPVTKAIKTFVTSREVSAMGMGLQYFPNSEDDAAKCQAPTYAALDVPLRELPENASAITSSIDAHYFDKAGCCTPLHDGTPTRPALEGVVESMRAWLKQHPERNGVILLATDGEPSPVCDDNGIDEASAVITAAAAGEPKIPTYVIGIGHEDALEQLADAGDTGIGALLVDGTGVDTERELLEALGKVRGDALPCDLPLPAGEDVDPFNVNVQLHASGEAPETLLSVPNAAACASTQRLAWYYDDPQQPTRFLLCPRTCEKAATERATAIKIVLGCATVVI